MKHKLFRFLCSALLIALMLAALGPVRPAYAASYTVNSLLDNTTAGDGFCTLREAIQSANNAGNGDCGANSPANDTITFSVGGTITLGSQLPNIVSGQGTLTIDGGGNITISGNNSVRVMIVDSGANLTLQNLTIANGRAAAGSGGGIRNDGTLTVTGSTFSGNSAGADGGGIFNCLGCTLTVTNSTFSGNSANNGGGISNNGGTLTVTGSTFSGNSAGGDGGGINNGGTLTVTNSTFSGNSAGFDGGGIRVFSGTVTVTNSTFSGNSANNGGGIYNFSGTLTVTNSTFSGNSAGDDGGGIFNDGGTRTLTVTNSTFSGNSANNNGGGIRVFSGTVTLKNTIIANSTGGGDCSGTLDAASINNLIESTGTSACGLTSSGGNIIGQDPQLASTLTGSPAYFPLLPGSPAIDAGDNTTCADPPVSNQSQNGVTRPKDGDLNGTAICDIGSYEVPVFYLFLPLIVR